MDFLRYVKFLTVMGSLGEEVTSKIIDTAKEGNDSVHLKYPTVITDDAILILEEQGFDVSKYECGEDIYVRIDWFK